MMRGIVRFCLAVALITLSLGGSVGAVAATETKPAHHNAAPTSTSEHAADHHGEAHESKGLPQMNAATYPSQLFWLVISFAAMFGAMAFIALPPVAKTLAHRDDLINGWLSEAQKLKEQSEYVRDHTSHAAVNADKEAKLLLDSVTAEVQAIAFEKNTALAAQLQRLIAESQNKIDRMQAEATTTIQQSACELATLIADKITGIKLSPAAAEPAIRALHNQMKGAA